MVKKTNFFDFENTVLCFSKKNKKLVSYVFRSCFVAIEVLDRYKTDFIQSMDTLEKPFVNSFCKSFVQQHGYLLKVSDLATFAESCGYKLHRTPRKEWIILKR